MSTLFHMNVEKSRKQPPSLPLEAQALAMLKLRLPPGAIALEAAEVPRIVICHKGRALGLHMMAPGRRLSVAETSAVIALRDAGMRVEVARGLGQALERLRDMGLVLEEDEGQDLRDVFRKETRRRS